MAATYLSYISHYRAEEELLAAAEKGEGEFVVPPGPVRMTSIVACLPAFTDPSGQSSGTRLSLLYLHLSNHADDPIDSEYTYTCILVDI